jgi:DNA-directed RNA polymerase specialized sigma subunit
MMTMMDDARKPKGQQTELTHEEIAKVMGVSRAYVSYLEKSALDKIRKVLEDRHNVRSSDDLL